jgi:hypothetical protein
VISRKTNHRHMTGDHHGGTARRATLLVRAADEILGTQGQCGIVIPVDRLPGVQRAQRLLDCAERHGLARAVTAEERIDQARLAWHEHFRHPVTPDEEPGQREALRPASVRHLGSALELDPLGGGQRRRVAQFLVVPDDPPLTVKVHQWPGRNPQALHIHVLQRGLGK